MSTSASGSGPITNDAPGTVEGYPGPGTVDPPWYWPFLGWILGWF